ncbi:hypothetical protein L1987_53111 [Smallanthus sonchifolius]|uniref:Uncharacterized protein n=1 Tax=Smallanthus sonchifolius TaxID=185202 RepID=A0ACB9EW57_9ASTR|nr:hypothetical protein L1987_53111 [Smallanthus sonchifolius]
MLIRNISKGKKQKVFEKEDEGKSSGKRLESVKKGKGKEKVEEGLQLKVDSGKKRKEPGQGQGQGQGQVSQDTMSRLIELEKQATKRIEEVENQKKKSESVNKNDPPSFRLLSKDSKEGNPEIEIGNIENVEKDTVGEKEIVEEMVGEKPVGGT